ncbi:hypothetical protein PAXRUDRAFT_15390 [Paxillus rubicundulus Ve08.2h10]|uniref:Unplaced genomic scaffold scaffold_1031, whole genome shotgun sequence n=1 Tax=Paxillus rubicundulus Ve08.2h10 TaxID=930991 RepID=A0A0D0DAX7_9AGAM|nr:hypothetical protein PAXRUDRAFT_15390 [Paxillus rubicundulus Ve08.2h10]
MVRRMVSSNTFTPPYPQPTPPLSHTTSQASSTQQTPHPEVCIPPSILSSQLSPSPSSCTLSLRTPTPINPAQQKTEAPLSLQPNCFLTCGPSEDGVGAAHQAPLAAPSIDHLKPSNIQKTTYPTDLTPLPSLLRPACTARDCLQRWLPAPPSMHNHQTSLATLQESDTTRIKDVMAHTWAESTWESYGSGLLVFHIFCDAKSIPDCNRAPYSGSTVANYLQGVHMWHVMHHLIWSHNDIEIEALLKAAVTLALTSSKHKPCELAAVFTCLTTTFWCTVRIGEFTVPCLDAFDPLLHVKPSNITHEKDRQGLMVTNFHLPRMKSALLGEDISWAQQHGPLDPQAAFQNHIVVNGTPVDGHLFASRHKGGHRPLTKSKFTASLSSAAKKAGIKPLQGHCIHIGSTLEYLL